MEMDINNRKLPEGFQSFSEIRERNCVYVDKTDIVWKLAHDRKFNYLSRPRRFGKSILVDTLRCYFQGRKELFDGLKINDYEKEWKAYPVIKFDMSDAGSSADTIKSYFNRTFRDLEQDNDIKTYSGDSLTDRFNIIVRSLHKKTGQKVVILIDEYDSPLQHSWKTEEHDKCTAVYRDVFAVLKSADEHEQFVFLTGITKFTQISLFSVLNNLTNISFFPEYADICGISEDEMVEYFQPEIQQLADKYGCTYEQAVLKLKENYDGYHFSGERMIDIYNPYSLVRALSARSIGNYWAESGATRTLPNFVSDLDTDIENYENYIIDKDTLEHSDVSCDDPGLFLYQTGYLTIKDADEICYKLGFPNTEVRTALFKYVFPALALHSAGNVSNEQINLKICLKNGDLPNAFKFMKALCADVPYSNKKLASIDMEERYRFILSVIFHAIGLRVEVERMMSAGRIDMIVYEPRHIYVFELKLQKNGGLESAVEQMKQRNYTSPFQADGREVVGMAIELDDNGKGLTKYLKVE